MQIGIDPPAPPKRQPDRPTEVPSKFCEKFEGTRFRFNLTKFIFAMLRICLIGRSRKFWTQLKKILREKFSVLSFGQGQAKCLEPISKLSEQDNEAGELDKAEEVLSVEFPADE